MGVTARRHDLPIGMSAFRSRRPLIPAHHSGNCEVHKFAELTAALSQIERLRAMMGPDDNATPK
jgi:hypothetical protein